MRAFFRKLIIRILTWEARLVVRRRQPSIIAVTGSVGKTSTKDAIYAALEDRSRSRKSEKSFNTELGIPLTILGKGNVWGNSLRWLQHMLDGFLIAFIQTAYPQLLILEVGADRPGDIRKIASWLPIDIAVITRLPEVPVHVEYFDSPEEVIEEKASLIAGLKPSGTLVLYGDDSHTAGLASRTRAQQITYGFSEDADVRGTIPRMLLDELGRVVGMEARVFAKGQSHELKIYGAVGSHVFAPALGAIAVGISMDIPLGELAAALERNYVPPAGRMHLLSGMRGSLIIDDSYNSSPAALEAALATLAAMPNGRKIAVLGDMMELGRYSVTEHRAAGVMAAKCADVLMTVGIRARDIAGAALDAGMPESAILQFEDSTEAGRELARLLAAGDTVLIKGSQTMRMERAVGLVMAEPLAAKNLLVRQEEAWSRD